MATCDCSTPWDACGSELFSADLSACFSSYLNEEEEEEEIHKINSNPGSSPNHVTQFDANVMANEDYWDLQLQSEAEEVTFQEFDRYRRRRTAVENTGRNVEEAQRRFYQAEQEKEKKAGLFEEAYRRIDKEEKGSANHPQERIQKMANGEGFEQRRLHAEAEKRRLFAQRQAQQLKPTHPTVHQRPSQHQTNPVPRPHQQKQPSGTHHAPPSIHQRPIYPPSVSPQTTTSQGHLREDERMKQEQAKWQMKQAAAVAAQREEWHKKWQAEHQKTRQPGQNWQQPAPQPKPVQPALHNAQHPHPTSFRPQQVPVPGMNHAPPPQPTVHQGYTQHHPNPVPRPPQQNPSPGTHHPPPSIHQRPIYPPSVPPQTNTSQGHLREDERLKQEQAKWQMKQAAAVAAQREEWHKKWHAEQQQQQQRNQQPVHNWQQHVPTMQQGVTANANHHHNAPSHSPHPQSVPPTGAQYHQSKQQEAERLKKQQQHAATQQKNPFPPSTNAQTWHHQQAPTRSSPPASQVPSSIPAVPPPAVRKTPAPVKPTPASFPAATPHQAPPSSTDCKYVKMTQDESKKEEESMFTIKKNILISWALLPPMMQTLRPIDELLTTVHTVFPAHDYFAKWKPISKESLVPAGGKSPGEEALKKAVRKIRFFLHPDKLPKNLDEKQSFICKLLWDVTSDAWEEYKQASHDLDWTK